MNTAKRRNRDSKAKRATVRGGVRVAVAGADRALTTSIVRAARETFRSEGIRRGSLCVQLCDDAEMARLHQEWMNDPTPTDVLTFDLRDQPDPATVDGELLVCRAVARREARARRADWRAEVILYVVHGCLHLCGHDDHVRKDAEAMHATEDRILTKLGWGAVYSASLPKLARATAKSSKAGSGKHGKARRQKKARSPG